MKKYMTHSERMDRLREQNDDPANYTPEWEREWSKMASAQIRAEREQTPWWMLNDDYY